MSLPGLPLRGALRMTSIMHRPLSHRKRLDVHLPLEFSLISMMDPSGAKKFAAVALAWSCWSTSTIDSPASTLRRRKS